MTPRFTQSTASGFGPSQPVRLITRRRTTPRTHCQGTIRNAARKASASSAAVNARRLRIQAIGSKKPYVGNRTLRQPLWKSQDSMIENPSMTEADVVRYRNKAQECLANADEAIHADDKAAWMELARQWSEMAEKSEERRRRGGV
jgi:hypothetical protein